MLLRLVHDREHTHKPKVFAVDLQYKLVPGKVVPFVSQLGEQVDDSQPGQAPTESITKHSQQSNLATETNEMELLK